MIERKTSSLRRPPPLVAAVLVVAIFMAGIATLGAKLHQAAYGDHECGDGIFCGIASGASSVGASVSILEDWTPPDFAEAKVVLLPQAVLVPRIACSGIHARAPPGFTAV